MDWLTTARKNELYRAIKGSGIEPAECKLLTHPWLKRLDILVPADFAPRPAVRIEGSANANSPDGFTFHVQTEVPDSTVSGTWTLVVNRVHSWARDAFSLMEPDLWEQELLRRQLAAVQGNDNSPFTDRERAEIAAQLKAIKDELQQQGKLSEGIKAALEEAEKASHHFGRKDWKTWFVGAVTTVIVAGTVTPEVGNHVLVTVLQGLMHLFGAGPVPMLPGG